VGVESTEDRLSFLNPEEFGTEAVVNNAKVCGIFSDAYAAIDEVTGEAATTAPQFLCRSADITAVGRGTTVRINSIDYKVIDIQPDGTGMTRLILSKDF
jgi:hypothetical protein